MSSTILGGDVTVYFLDENRQKRMEWSGSASGTQTVNALYSAMADLLDEPTTGDDATAMTAETPVEYTVGLIDANDADPWFMSFEMIQHLTGGAIKTSGWTHTDGSATGIVIVPVTSSSTIVAGDYGLDISGATNGNGTLLEILNIGETTQYLVIRPDTNAAGDNFATAAQTITVNAHTGSQTPAVPNTGEMIWANLFNVTPIDADTHVYMYQGLVSDATRARVDDVNIVLQDWWEEGSFDRLIRANDYKDVALAVIDGGNITCFARKGNTLYDNFPISTSLTSGGRNPVPLSASADGNQTTGYSSITFTAVSVDTFAVGDEITGLTSLARGIITQIDGSGATQTLHYYLVGDPLTDFQTAAETIENNDNSGSGTKDGLANALQGPALTTWFTANAFPTAVHANTTSDIDDDGTAEGYGVLLDCNANPLTEVYEWSKYVTRNGATTTTATDGIEGEQYVGPTVYLEYSGSVTGTMTEGNDVTQATSLATGIIVSHDTTLKQMLLRDVRGVFTTTGLVTDNDASGTMTPDTAATAFDAVKSAPFGAFAGGRWFLARGVTLVDWVSADENSFQQIDSQGNARTRPIAITLTVSNLVGGAATLTTSDQVWMHRLLGSGLAIDKTEYSAAGGEAAGSTSIAADTTINADVPGKTTGGVLNIRDFSDSNQHYRLRYSSWVTSTFTLASISALTLAGGTSTTQVVTTGGELATAKRGDLVNNITQGAVSYVTSVDDTNTVQISPAITGQTSGDDIDINTNPVLIDTLDDIYVSLIDEHALTSSAEVSIVYVSPIFFRVKVANTRNATVIKRFVTDGTTSGTDQSVATIRTTDTIYV
jgi:hypothetical protein